MAKKFTNLTVCLLAVLMLLSIFTITPVSAITYTGSKGKIKVVCGSYSHTFNAKNYGKNFSRAFNYALYIASKKATDKKKATVTVAKGNYKIDRTIYIYSDTKLIATGCRFKRRDNIISNGYDKRAYSAKGYSGARNITIVGGTWDIAVPYSQANTKNTKVMHSTFRFGHCKNITIDGCTFKNNYNCHDIEMGGVDKAVIKNCTFANDKNVNKYVTDGGREAVQIDLNTQPAVPYFPSYDCTTSKNITIKNNTFKNKYRGIGSHHAMVGATYDNISVHNNTFTNIAGFSVYAVYWTNSKIYSNTFTNVGAGIDIRPMTVGEGMNFHNYKNLSYLNSEYVMKESKIYVYDNNINVRKTTNTCNYPFGIRVCGTYVDKKDATTKVNIGEYNAYNVNIGVNSNGTSKPNVIKGNLYYGIYTAYGVKCNIKNNIIDLANSNVDYSYGIVVKGSKKTLVHNNTISNGNKPTSRGVYVGATTTGTPSEYTTVSNNKINNFAFAGLSVVDSADTVFTNNTSDGSKYGATISAAVNTTLTKNILKGCTLYGVYSYKGSTGTKVTENNITSTDYGFSLNDKDDLYFSEEKTLVVNNNVFNTPEGTTPINMRYANLAARVYDNFNSDNGYAVCRIKGTEQDKYVYCYNDFSMNGIVADNTDSGVYLSWDNTDNASGYRIYRTVYGEDTSCLCDISDNFYDDVESGKYMSETGISYSACPILSSSSIKLLGEATPFVTIH